MRLLEVGSGHVCDRRIEKCVRWRERSWIQIAYFVGRFRRTRHGCCLRTGAHVQEHLHRVQLGRAMEAGAELWRMNP